MSDFKRSNEARQQIIVRLAQRIVDGSYFDGDYLMVNKDFLEAYAEMEMYFSPPKPNDPVSNLEGDLGSSHMQGTPKAQGHEADNLSAESAGKE